MLAYLREWWAWLNKVTAPNTRWANVPRAEDYVYNPDDEPSIDWSNVDWKE